MTGRREYVEVRDHSGRLLHVEVMPHEPDIADLIARLDAVATGEWRGTAIADLCRQAADALEALQAQQDRAVPR